MSKNILQTLLVLCLMLITACAGVEPTKENIMPVTNPVSQTRTFEKDLIMRTPEASSGIWSEATSGDFFQDLRAYKKGDLVTVNIVETSSASKSASTQTGRDSSINAGINNLMGWEGSLNSLASFGKSNVSSAFDNTSMLKGSFSNSFNGTGSTSRGDRMTASITATVIDVKPNGNLLIRGIREIRVNSETQIIILSGTIRSIDISPNNTILSSYIGDARIEYVGTGVISEKQRPGWLARAADIVWPF